MEIIIKGDIHVDIHDCEITISNGDTANAKEIEDLERENAKLLFENVTKETY